MNDIISETQSCFLKNRYIGECTRLTYDLLEKAEKEDIPGILLLLDFEKAFDSLEWTFMQKTLRFLGFGESIIKWINKFYTDVSSCVQNNGHLYNFFSINRGVRQGDPLSPYLFICVELLSAAIKYDPNIKGRIFNDTEYLISQYADDTSLTLGYDQNSLNETLDFSELSGLRANFD